MVLRAVMFATTTRDNEVQLFCNQRNNRLREMESDLPFSQAGILTEGSLLYRSLLPSERLSFVVKKLTGLLNSVDRRTLMRCLRGELDLFYISLCTMIVRYAART